MVDWIRGRFGYRRDGSSAQQPSGEYRGIPRVVDGYRIMHVSAGVAQDYYFKKIRQALDEVDRTDMRFLFQAIYIDSNMQAMHGDGDSPIAVPTLETLIPKLGGYVRGQLPLP